MDYSEKFAALTAIVALLILASRTVQAGTSVIYTQQVADYPTTFFSGTSGYFNQSGNQLGMYSHGSSPQAVAWRNFMTADANGGNARSLQVGDVFQISVSATRAYGQMGFSLNSGGTQGSSYANNISGSRLYFNSDNFGAWYVNRSGGTTVFGSGYYPIQGAFKNYNFTVRITSQTTADAVLTVDGVAYNAYNLTMNGAAGANINAYSIYLSDDWDGANNQNIYWQQITGVTNSGVVQLGYYLTSGTFTPGLITDGLDAASTSTTSTNSVYIGGDSGSAVILNQANTFTGPATINANATAQLQNSTGFGSATGSRVSVTTGGRIQISNGVTVSSTKDLTLNGSGISSSGALENTSGNNDWEGNVTLGSSSTVASDSGTLTLSGNVDFQSQAHALTVSGPADTVINGSFINVINGGSQIVKSGAGTLTINGNTSTSASHLMFNDYGGIISISSANAIAVPTDVSYPDKFNFLDNATLQVTANSFTLGNYTDSSHNCGFRIQGGKTATFDVANGSTLTIDGQIIDVPSTGSGALTKISAGTLTVNGDNSYSGGTTVSGGTLLVNNTSGSGTGSGTVTVSGGTLGGNGTINGAITVGSGSSGTLSPGSAGSGTIGTLTLGSSLTLGGPSTASMEINKAGMTDTADKVVASGAVAYDGQLNVTASGDTLASGDSFTLFTGSGFSGWFSNISLPAVGSGLTWDTNDLATTGVLDVYTFTTTTLSFATVSNAAATISASKVASHAVSAKAATYATGFSASANGGSVVINGDHSFTYTPSTAADIAGTDSFNLIVQDGHGLPQTLAVSVTVHEVNAGPTITPTQTGSEYGMFTASGIPGTNYVIQIVTNMTAPMNWSDYATNAALSNGLITFTDSMTVTDHGGQVYYRLRQQ